MQEFVKSMYLKSHSLLSVHAQIKLRKKSTFQLNILMNNTFKTNKSYLMIDQKFLMRILLLSCNKNLLKVYPNYFYQELIFNQCRTKLLKRSLLRKYNLKINPQFNLRFVYLNDKNFSHPYKLSRIMLNYCLTFKFK